MPSPTRLRRHGCPHSRVNWWLTSYEAATPGVLSASNASVRMDVDNMPQPDAFLLIDPARGGQTRISDDDCVEGAPELIAEVTASSASYDLYEKKNAYRRNGVREYVVLLTEENRVLWFVLRDGQFADLPADSAGMFRSEIFPGLWLDASALVAGNLAQVQNLLEQGVATPEHAEFVRRLADAAK
jgi:Uma2 family endonuclease